KTEDRAHALPSRVATRPPSRAAPRSDGRVRSMSSSGEVASSSDRVYTASGLVTQPIEDSLLLLHLDSGVFFELDDVGARMWQLLRERGDVDAIVPKLLEEYDVEEARLRRDLSRLVAE